MSIIKQIYNGFGDILLYCIFTLILVVCLMILISSFNNLTSTNIQLEKRANEIVNYLQRNVPAQNAKFKSELNLFIERIKATSKLSLESNTISFLFQIFSISLVSVGVYLLKRSQSNLQAAEIKSLIIAKKANMIGPFISNNLFSSTLTSHLSITYQVFLLLQKGSDDNVTSAAYIALARDSLNTVKNELEKARQQKIGLIKEQFDFYLDKLTFIQVLISNLPNGISKRSEDLAFLSEETIDLLKNTDFIGNYDNYSKLLLDRGETA